MGAQTQLCHCVLVWRPMAVKHEEIIKPCAARAASHVAGPRGLQPCCFCDACCHQDDVAGMRIVSCACCHRFVACACIWRSILNVQSRACTGCATLRACVLSSASHAELSSESFWAPSRACGNKVRTATRVHKSIVDYSDIVEMLATYWRGI